jgi:hypothetical protein
MNESMGKFYTLAVRTIWHNFAWKLISSIQEILRGSLIGQQMLAPLEVLGLVFGALQALASNLGEGIYSDQQKCCLYCQVAGGSYNVPV